MNNDDIIKRLEEALDKVLDINSDDKWGNRARREAIIILEALIKELKA
jgi:hypothetical protein